jgi:ribosomal protein S18 acetylase RimI-like enzyme
LKHLRIAAYTHAAEQQVVDLWSACRLSKPWNDPRLDIQRKLDHSPDLFYLAWIDARVVGSCMAGYDGHRGWIYYLGVTPQLQGKGIARRLVEHGETQLAKIGCPKINLMVRKANTPAMGFYKTRGYEEDPVVVLSKRLVNDPL